MKKVFSMICALSLAMSTMLVSTVAEAEKYTFVDDNEPKLIAECSKVVPTGVATIDVYLEFGKYDFVKYGVSSTVFDEEEYEDVDYYSGKGVSGIQVSIDLSKESYKDGSATANTNLPSAGIAYDADTKTLNYISYSSNMTGLFIPTERVKLFSYKMTVDTSYSTGDTPYPGTLYNEVMDLDFTELGLKIWTLDEQRLETSKVQADYGIGKDKAIEVQCGAEKATTIDPESVTIAGDAAAIKVGDTKALTATVAPADATDKTITWSSNNTAVATVDANGAVTAVAPGKATITAASSKAGVEATFVVKVLPKVTGADDVAEYEGTYIWKNVTINGAKYGTNYEVTFAADGAEKTKALDISAIEVGGDVSFPILLKGAPADVTAEIGCTWVDAQ